MDAALKLILCDGTVLYIGPMTKNDARLYVQWKRELGVEIDHEIIDLISPPKKFEVWKNRQKEVNQE